MIIAAWLQSYEIETNAERRQRLHAVQSGFVEN